MSSWGALLNDVYLTASCELDDLPQCVTDEGPADAVPCAVGELSGPPDGLGIPGRRVEDITYPQRDGVRMFNDWYEARTLTFEEVIVCHDPVDCGEGYDCTCARRRVQQIGKAWSIACGLTELVLFTDCHDGDTSTNLTQLGPNTVTNPSAEENLDGYTVTGGTIEQDCTTVVSFRAPCSVRMDKDPGTETARLTYSGVTPVVAGAQYQASWTLLGSEDFERVSISILFYGAAGAVVGSASADYTIMASEPTTIRVQGMPPTGAVSVGLLVDTTSEMLWATDLQIREILPVEDRSATGPYGVVGKARVAELEWTRTSPSCAILTLRFDAVDHRMYILDECGTPGSGESCVTLDSRRERWCRAYDRCYDDACGGWRYNIDTTQEGAGPQELFIPGTECGAQTTITLSGKLTNPVVENLDTGDRVGYQGVIGENDPPVVIDLDEGTATQGGQSRSHLLTGDPRMALMPGSNRLQLLAYSTTDNGTAEVCTRGSVIMG